MAILYFAAYARRNTLVFSPEEEFAVEHREGACRREVTAKRAWQNRYPASFGKTGADGYSFGHAPGYLLSGAMD